MPGLVDEMGRADALALSPKTFARRGKAACGSTPARFVKTARVEPETRLLATTMAPVEEVSAGGLRGSVDSEERAPSGDGSLGAGVAPEPGDRALKVGLAPDRSRAGAGLCLLDRQRGFVEETDRLAPAVADHRAATSGTMGAWNCPSAFTMLSGTMLSGARSSFASYANARPVQTVPVGEVTTMVANREGGFAMFLNVALAHAGMQINGDHPSPAQGKSRCRKAEGRSVRPSRKAGLGEE